MSSADQAVAPETKDTGQRSSLLTLFGRHLSRARRTAGLGALMAGLVVVFAFVTACFPAGNSDLLLHLATGRAVLEQGLPTGADPFSATTGGGAWAPAWLFDVLLYALYSLPEVGPAAVVVFKAALAALLAGALIAAGRPAGGSRSLAVAAACAGLAVLALSPRLSLQPVVVSYLFLGLTVWLLRRGLEEDSRRSLWLLVPLFALWANTDEHFLVGPAAGALALLGQFLQRLWPGTRMPPTGRELAELAGVLAAGLLVCLLNPAGIHALRLPWQLGLSPVAAELRGDPELRYLFLSPLDRAYYQPGLGLNVAGLAVFPLALLGLASLLVSLRTTPPRWWRLVVWAGFLFLGLASCRGLAFFAIVAGPLLALGALDVLAARRPRAPRWSLLGHILGVLAAAGLVVLSFPGWLQGQPARRHFGLEVRLDESLKQTALQLGEWRRQGLLRPDDRVFHSTPDVACYLAWFCPEVKGFLDPRLAQTPQVQRDFALCRAALASSDTDQHGEPGWRPVFRRHGVRYLVLHFRDARRPAARAALARLLLSTYGPPGGEWSLCYLDGRSAIATWHDASEQRAGPPPLKLERRAFAAGPSGAGPPVQGKPRSWLAAPLPRSPAADEAICFRTVYQLLEPIQAWRQARALQTALAASSMAAAATPTLPGPAGQPALHLALAGAATRQQMQQNYRANRDAAPVPALYLSLRAARRALAEQPHDADMHFLLAQGYRELSERSREAKVRLEAPQVALIRQAQVAAALQQAVRLDPNHEGAHALLAATARQTLYLGRMQAGSRGSPVLVVPNLELERAHRQHRLRCVRERGPAPAVSRQDFQRGLEVLEKEVAALDNRLRALRDRFEVAAARQGFAVRAELALERGLVETALAELWNAWQSGDMAQSHRGSAARLIELLLATGRQEQASGLLEQEGLALLAGVSTPLGLPASDWFSLVAAAAAGRYARADDVLARAQAGTQRQPGASAILAQATAHVLLWEAPLAARMPALYVRRLPALLGLPPTREAFLSLMLAEALGRQRQKADLAALRGWLALESGDSPAARQHFHQVLALCRTGDDRLLALPAVPLARLGLERLD